MVNIEEILLYLSDGHRECFVCIPDFRDVKAEIVEIKLVKGVWKPIKVKFREKVNHIVRVLEEYDSFGYEMEPSTHMVEKLVPYLEDWINLEFIKLKGHDEEK